MNDSARHLRDGTAVVTGNTYDKYRTSNPIARRLQNGFLTAANELVRTALDGLDLGEREPEVLEIGCGPGDLATALFAERQVKYTGFDIDISEVDTMRRALTSARSSAGTFPPRPVTASAYELPFADESFDLVLTCEVLEHLESPAKAVEEIARVARGPILLSVPWEPTWRVLNLMRGSYVLQLGNTPGHLQNFSRAAFRRLLSNALVVEEERRPLPWTMVLARPRADRATV